MLNVVGWILAAYPRWWRDRYGDETTDLTTDLLADPDVRSWRVMANLAFGVVAAWSQHARRSRRILPVSGATPWGTVPNGGHRDMYFNRGLSVRSSGALNDDEVLLGVIDGWRGSPFLDQLPVFSAIYLAMAIPVRLLFGMPSIVGTASLVTFAPWVGLLVIGTVLRRATSTRSVALAVTNQGLVVLQRSRLTYTTGRVLERLPASRPNISRRRVLSLQVQLDGRKFWMRGSSEPLLAWMAHSLSCSGSKTG